MNTPPTAASKPVLIVEDSPTQGLHLQALLREHGLQTICAWNGEAGVKLAQQLHPGLIVLDMYLPDIDGREVCRRLRSAPDTAHIPVIIFTRSNDPQIINDSFAAGITDFIPKDVFADAVLIETLRQIGFIAT
jgi:CheY-like chemotaxis protein